MMLAFSSAFCASASIAYHRAFASTIPDGARPARETCVQNGATARAGESVRSGGPRSRPPVQGREPALGTRGGRPCWLTGFRETGGSRSQAPGVIRGARHGRAEPRARWGERAGASRHREARAGVVQCTERRAVAPPPVGMTVDEIFRDAGGGPPRSGRERECCWGRGCGRANHPLVVSWRGHITPWASAARPC
jgi:hypothetical protein